jgi:surface antigen
MQSYDFTSDVDTFIAEIGTSYSWFNSTALNDLTEICDQNTNSTVIVMMGVNDCAQYTLGYSSNVENYANTVNNLIEQYSDITFYFCSVNPVYDDYPSIYHPDGKIPKEDFTEAIKEFNKVIKDKCNAKYIDCYGYLESSGFSGSDGLHYDEKTTKSVYDHVVNTITNNLLNIKFSPRLEKPTSKDTFWVSTQSSTEEKLENNYGVDEPFGKNPYPAKEVNGFVLPSNTAYVWGRFSEILKADADLPITDNAEDWFKETSYETGLEPRVGSIICWAGGIAENENDGLGHIAVVEKIIDENTLTISESLSSSLTTLSEVFRVEEINNTNGNWGKDSSYVFKGFIYNPGVSTGGAYVDNIQKSQVVTTTGWINEESRRLNARYICKYLINCGWSLNAVAGLLGNLEHESYINPGVTEFGGSGYGLVQWTPPSKFTNWCDAQNPKLDHDDVDAQLARIEHERNHDFGVHNGGNAYSCSCNQYNFYTADQYGTKFTGSAGPFGPEKFYDFATSTKSPYDLACAFLYNYEKPASIIYGANADPETGRTAYQVGLSKTPEQREAYRKPVREKRGATAEKWYKYLLEYCGTAEKLVISNLRVTDEKPTEVKVSFLVQNGKEYSYILKCVDSDVTDQNVESVSIKESAHLIRFNIKDLIPNTKYTLSVTVNGIEKNSKETFDEITFITPQDYPDSVKNIVLKAEKWPLPDQSFKVSIEEPGYWGYWKKNGCGYNIELILDGYLLEEISSSVVSEFNFIPRKSTLFGEKNIEIGTNLQIGVRTWVKDNSGIKIYSKRSVASNPICLLNQPIRIFLNTK